MMLLGVPRSSSMRLHGWKRPARSRYPGSPGSLELRGALELDRY